MSCSAAELYSRYNDAESNLNNLFAEQKSNLLLVAGNHYANRSSKFQSRLKEIESISRQQKIRLTKNHIQRITKTYINNILAYAPDVGAVPKNDDEVSDVKVAEMHQAVWLDLKQRSEFRKLTRKWAKDYIEVGEAIAKVFYDEKAGDFLGYDPLYDEHGFVVHDEQNNPVYDESPVFSGDIVFERIHGFNLLTDPTARSWEECRWVIYRKMVPVAHLKAMFSDESMQHCITESAETTFKIFDSATGTYRDGEGLCMVMEHYYRACDEYPEGYYYIAVQGGVLAEGDLPLGLFPIVYCGFDEASTSARSFSIIKQLRPYQAEINRCASKIAEHQITLGDDKILLSNGATMTPGGSAHGVKAIHTTGGDPKVFSGRTGEQYVGYMNGEIDGMYRVAMIEEDSMKDVGQLDPYALLYKTARQKKPFMIYIDKFEEFLAEICKLSLRFAKAFYADDRLIPAVTKKEYLNIAEFRKAEDLGYQIKIEGQSEDLETRMGKQLVMNHLVQFAGGQMSLQDIGMLSRNMPFMSDGAEVFGDMTQKYDNWVNDRLAMDRGQMIHARPGEPHDYLVMKIQGRMKERDFDLLQPISKQNWLAKEQEHLRAQAEDMAAKQRAAAGFIPTGGFLCTVEMYQPDPHDPTKTVRVKLPSETIQWVQNTIAQQGTTQAMLQGFDAQNQAQVMQMVNSGNRPAPGLNQAPRPALAM